MNIYTIKNNNLREQFGIGNNVIYQFDEIDEIWNARII